MMTAHKITSAQDTKHYFEKDNYYTKEEGINDSFWVGQGSERLGLSGQVDPDVFYRLLKGEFEGQQLGRKTQEGIEHRPGLDCTFNAPKSVSILTEVFDHSAMRAAHLEAVKVAVQYLEKTAAQARLTKAGETAFVKTNNLTVAAFTHDTSRELDPHLHTHCVVMNGTHTSEGWRSLSNELILKAQKKAGAIYRNELAYRARKLGFEIRHIDKGMFELGGFDEATLNQFSTRREQILEYMASHNLAYTPSNAQVATLATRQAKQDVERESLRALWKEKASHLGLGVTPLTTNEAGDEAPNLRRALRYSIRHLSEKDMAFTEEAIIERLLSYDAGLSSFDKIKKEIGRFRREGLLVEADNNKLTTPYGVRLEKDLLSRLYRGFDTVDSFISSKKVTALLHSLGLDDDQYQAVYQLSQSRDRYFGIRGLAGTGKTTTLAAIKPMLEKGGYRTVAMAPTHTAAEKMSASLGFDACTLDYFLTSNGEGALLPSAGRKGEKEIWIVDEATFGATRRIRKLMRLAEKRDARVLFLGDHRQLESIEAGRAFKQMQDAGMACATLSKIYRQRSNELLKAVELAYERDISASLGKLKKEMVEDNLAQGRHTKIAQDWLSLNKDEQADAAIIVTTNEERKSVNHLVREGLIEQGQLSRDAKKYTSFTNRYLSSMETRKVDFYRMGDVVRFSQAQNVGRKKGAIKRNEYFDVVGMNAKTNELFLLSRQSGQQIRVNPNRIGGRREGGIDVFEQDVTELRRGDTIKWTDNKNKLGLKRNDTLTVKFINDKTVTLEGDGGRRVEIKAKELTHAHFAHKYALTVYGSQGDDYSRVFVLLDSKRINAVNQTAYLVAISRAKDMAKLYVDDAKKVSMGLGERLGDNTTALKKDRVQEYRANKGVAFLL